MQLDSMTIEHPAELRDQVTHDLLKGSQTASASFRARQDALALFLLNSPSQSFLNRLPQNRSTRKVRAFGRAGALNRLG